MNREKLNNLIKQTVRRLRKTQTESEMMFWRAVRNRKLAGKKFLRQYPIVFEWRGKKRFLIADFYCHEAQLIIEVDGGIHQEQKDYDQAREFVLKSLGMRIVRFTNSEIKNNLKVSLTTLMDIFISAPSLIKRGRTVKR